MSNAAPSDIQQKTARSMNAAPPERVVSNKKSNAAPKEKVKIVTSSNAAAPQQVISITESSEYKDLGAFYLKKTYSDVTLIVEEREIPAHKIVLAARCKYFEQFLPDDPTMTTLIVSNAPFQAFRRILKYIYTGDMTIEASNGEMIFDVIRLAHEYSLTDLEKTMSGKLDSFLDMTNVFQILNKANDYDIDDMKETCHIFMDRNLSKIFENDCLTSLTQKSMINFLKRLSGSVPEMKTFQVVQKWCASNTDTNNLVKNYVCLTSLSLDDILDIVRPSKMFEETQILDAVAKIRKNESQQKMDKNNATEFKATESGSQLVMDKNIATVEFKAKVITGNRTSHLLTKNNDLKKCAYHPVGDKNGITVDLGQLFRFNYIKFKLKNSEKLEFDLYGEYYTNTNSYRYYIEISTDQNNWKNIIDYTKYDCRSYQNLYFEQQVARYIRIVGTYSSESTNFEIVSLELYCKSVIPKIINQIVRPTDNVATPDMGAIVTEGYVKRIIKEELNYFENRWNPEYLLNGDVNSSSTCHKIGLGHIIVQLAQPYLISNMRLLLFNDNNNGHKYSYFIETSVNGTEWKIAVDRRNQECQGWQDLQFEERPVIYVRITGTFGSIGPFGPSIDCKHFECPSAKV